MFNKKQQAQKDGLDIVYYEKMVNDLLSSFGLDPEKCRHRPRTLWSAYRGSALVYIDIFKLEDIDYIEISCPIMLLPSRNLLVFYKKLLEFNYQLMGVKFFVRDQWVYLAENRGLKGLDSDELKGMIERVSYHADRLDEALIEEFKSQTD
uniref:YbjN domain-containing protein n=1 Tax=candidate division WOR-3 bacterium TaxID=2052148 RepID=A0A7V0Z3W1_UNCW3